MIILNRNVAYLDWTVCAMIRCLLLYSMLIEFVKNKSPYVWHGYMYAFGMFCSAVFGVMCTHHNYNIAYTTGLRVRTALTSAIYRKVPIVSRIFCFMCQTIHGIMILHRCFSWFLQLFLLPWKLMCGKPSANVSCLQITVKQLVMENQGSFMLFV